MLLEAKNGGRGSRWCAKESWKAAAGVVWGLNLKTSESDRCRTRKEFASSRRRKKTNKQKQRIKT